MTTDAELRSLAHSTREVLALHKCRYPERGCPTCIGMRDAVAGIEKLLPPADHGTIEAPSAETAERLANAASGSLFG